MARQLRLKSHISDGMVIQQQLPYILKGYAKAGSDVNIRLEREPYDGRSISPLDHDYGCLIDDNAKCLPDGSFSYEIPAYAASFDIFILTLKCGREELIINDIKVGEVWLLAGNSCLCSTLNEGLSQDRISELARFPDIRILVQSEDGLGKKTKSYSAAPAKDLVGAQWLRGDDTGRLGRVSAVSYFFARNLQLELKLPVAVIEIAMADSFSHSWLARELIDENQDLRAQIEKYGFYRDDNTWNMAGDWGHHQPGALYNHKLAPLSDCGLRGIIWQQGDKDRCEPEYYLKLMKTLAKSWNKLFRSPEPEIEGMIKGVAWVLVSCPPALYSDDGDGLVLARYTETLYKLKHWLDCPSAALPTYDLLTENSKDNNKRGKIWTNPELPFSIESLGSRISTIAQGMSYMRKAPPSAPECSSIDIVGNKMLLSFKNTGEGLRLSGNDGRLKGFSICGADRVFHEAQAKLLYGVRVMIWHDQIRQPESLTYAFSSLNQESNLINRDLLPTLPFRADLQESVYKLPMEWLHCDSLHVWGTKSNTSDFSRSDWKKNLSKQPAWQVTQGNAELKIETANKKEGDASFLITYKNTAEQAAVPEIVIGPRLDYDSLFPPFDFSAYNRLNIDIFNPDRQMKRLVLRFFLSPDLSVFKDSKQKIVMSALRWQTYSFLFEDFADSDLKKIYGIAFCLTDEKLSGSVYIDNIQLLISD